MQSEEDKRLLYKDHMTAAADKVENLGNFLELEIIVAKEEERAGGLDMIYELMRMLGCEKTETVRDSYLSMLENEVSNIRKSHKGQIKSQNSPSPWLAVDKNYR